MGDAYADAEGEVELQVLAVAAVQVHLRWRVGFDLGQVEAALAEFFDFDHRGDGGDGGGGHFERLGWGLSVSGMMVG